jgi:lauroyl/myristoyl acyltransferase
VTLRAAVRRRLGHVVLAPDGHPRPDAPFGRGALAARVLRLALRGATAIASRLPAPATHGAAVFGGTVEWAIRPGLRRQLAENLCHAVGRPADHRAVAALVRAEVVNEARRSADLLWALARPDELVASTEIVGREHVHEALGRGRGVILASLHLGGWEVATAIPREVVPVPTSVVVADDWIAWAIQGMRSAAGLRVIYRTEPVVRATRLLERGEALLVLGEDAAGDMARRRCVRFLDAHAELPAGVAALARLCGTPIVPFTVLPLGPRRWRVTADTPVIPPERRTGEDGEVRLLQHLADLWSEQLRAHPEHWAARFPIDWKAGR